MQKNSSAVSYRLEDFKKLLLIREKPRVKCSKNKAEELKGSILTAKQMNKGHIRAQPF